MARLHPLAIGCVAALLCGSTSAQANADTQSESINAPGHSLAWMAGWDDFSEPLDYASSSVSWRMDGHAKVLFTYVLTGAKPSKLYQVGMHFFNLCSGRPPTMFGQFPLSACETVTRQGVTATVDLTEVGVVTTDAMGNGTFSVVIGPIQSGIYQLEFDVRNGAGCAVKGGGGTRPRTCNVDFQSPGPFGTTTTVVVP